MNRFWIFLLLLVCQLAAILAPIRALWALIWNPDQAFEICKAYDLLGSAVTNGKAKEYISTRANEARTKGKPWGCILCKVLDAIQPNHCAESANA